MSRRCRRPRCATRPGSPLPLLEDVGVCLLDQSADPAERLAAPVAELGDSLADQLRPRLAFLPGPGAFHRRLVGMIRTYPIWRLEGNSPSPSLASPCLAGCVGRLGPRVVPA